MRTVVLLIAWCAIQDCESCFQRAADADSTEVAQSCKTCATSKQTSGPIASEILPAQSLCTSCFEDKNQYLVVTHWKNPFTTNTSNPHTGKCIDPATMSAEMCKPKCFRKVYTEAQAKQDPTDDFPGPLAMPSDEAVVCSKACKAESTIQTASGAKKACCSFIKLIDCVKSSKADTRSDCSTKKRVSCLGVSDTSNCEDITGTAEQVAKCMINNASACSFVGRTE